MVSQALTLEKSRAGAFFVLGAACKHFSFERRLMIVAKRVGQKIKMTSIDELLCVPSVAGCDEIEVAVFRWKYNLKKN